MQTRLVKLREIIVQEKLDAVMITQAENRRYMSGFTGSAGVLLIDQERALLATDFRYYEQVKMQAPGFELVQVTDSPQAALAPYLKDGLRVGFESHALTVQAFEQWKSALPAIEWVATAGLVENLRQIKDARELAAIRQAVRIADDAMQHIAEWVRPGMTERQISWELEVTMRTHGAEALSFTTIVASGPNGAMAHAVTTDRVINAGDPIVIDMGAMYEGYCSDLTRSFCVGRATEEYLTIWDTVLQAQLAAVAAIKAGLSGVEADAVARQLIYAAGFDGQFGHGLGHGVGLAIHEAPRVGMTSKDVLSEGAIVTVEPGIYVPGWGGVRIEDMVVVTQDTCQVLTQAPKTPLVGAAR
jgi:Xaa-Pro aminopeptidase